MARLIWTKKEYEWYVAHSPVWRAKSIQNKNDAGWRCQLCGARTQLETHHNTYANLGDELPSELICLCERCHRRFTTETKRKTFEPDRYQAGVQLEPVNHSEELKQMWLKLPLWKASLAGKQVAACLCWNILDADPVTRDILSINRLEGRTVHLLNQETREVFAVDEEVSRLAPMNCPSLLDHLNVPGLVSIQIDPSPDGFEIETIECSRDKGYLCSGDKRHLKCKNCGGIFIHTCRENPPDQETLRLWEEARKRADQIVPKLYYELAKRSIEARSKNAPDDLKTSQARFNKSLYDPTYLMFVYQPNPVLLQTIYARYGTEESPVPLYLQRHLIPT